MKAIYSRRASATLLASAALAGAAPAWAQAASDATPQSASDATPANASGATTPGNDIIVTARRQAENLKDVPQAINVVTGSEIKKLNVFDFREISQLAPGLQLTNNDGRSNVATLRGITFDPDSGTLPSVAVYINDIPVDPQTAFTAIYDVGQIEVLRGPQGIFRGVTTPAGAITLTTRRPDLEQPGGYAQLTGNNRSGVNFQGAETVPIVPGVLSIRAAMLIDYNHNNRVHDVNTDDGSRADTQSARLSVAFSPSSAFHSVLTYQYLSSDTRPYIAVFGPGNQPSPLAPARSGPPATIRDRIAVTEGAPRFRNRTDLMTLASDYDFGPMTLSLNGGYQDTILRQHRDLDVANAVPGYRQIQNVTTPYKVGTADLRLSSNGEHFFNWMIGGFYQHQTNSVVVHQNNDQFFAVRIPGLGTVPLPASLATFPLDVTVLDPGFSRQLSGFGSVRFDITDRLKVEGGLRYTDFKIRQQSILTVFAPTFGANLLDGVATVPADLATRTYHSVTGGADISYKITDQATAYVSYGHSFRPGVAAVGVTTQLSPATLVSRSETSNSVEVGLKADLFDRRVSVSADMFYQKFKNYIAYQPCLTTNSSRVPGAVDPACAPLPTNGNASSRGAEAQITAHVSRRFDFNVSASYADAHYDHAEVYCNDYNNDGVADSNGIQSVQPGREVSVCARNDRLSQIPKFSLTANGEYHVDLGSLQPFLRGLVSYRPGFFSTYDDFKYRAYTNLSLFAGLRGPQDKWELTVYSKNILDQRRATSVSQGNGVYPTSVPGAPAGTPSPNLDSGYRTAVISLPREIGLTLQFNF